MKTTYKSYYIFLFIFLLVPTISFSKETPKAKNSRGLNTLKRDFYKSKKKIETSSSNFVLKKKAYKYQIAVTTIFKDDAPWLREWIEYHKLLGVQHFRLYNNDSSDNFLEVLRPYIAKGEVTLINWSSENMDLAPGTWWPKVQYETIKDAINNLRGICKWLAIIDTDEFIVPKHADNLVSYLMDYEDYGGLVINWQCFGTSRVWDIPEDQLMIECLTKKVAANSGVNEHVKSIMRPEYINIEKSPIGPHWFWYYLGHSGVAPDKQSYTPGLQRWGIHGLDSIQINHYYLRTLNNFYNFKIPKKERMDGITLTKEHIENLRAAFEEVEDTSILRFAPALRKRMGMDR